MATLTLVAKRPFINPDSMFVKVTPAAAYVSGTPDEFSMVNIPDPKGIGQVPLNNPPVVTPGIFSENLTGYYAEVVKGSTLLNYGLRYFAPGGDEVGSGDIPADILNGELVLEIVVPLDQQD